MVYWSDQLGAYMKITAESMADRVAARLAELIRDGEYLPGDRLPPERRLSELFGVARSTVREAIRTLARACILESRPGSGTYVSPGTTEATVETLIQSIAHGRRQLWEIAQVRLLMEPGIAQLAAENATNADVAELKLLFAAQRQAIERGESGHEPDTAFHNALVRISRNSVLMDLTESLTDAMVESRAEYLLDQESREDALRTHERMLNAIESGDGQAARQAMFDHLTHLQNHVRLKTP